MTTERHNDGRYIITEHDSAMFGECRFAVDRREHDGDISRLANVGWYKTYRGALNAMSMEKSSER